MAAPGERRWHSLARVPVAKSRYGVRLDKTIKVTRDLGESASSDAILIVVPAQAIRSVVMSLASSIADHTPLIACAKGIEHGTRKFMTEIIAECAPKAVRRSG